MVVGEEVVHWPQQHFDQQRSDSDACLRSAAAALRVVIFDRDVIRAGDVQVRVRLVGARCAGRWRCHGGQGVKDAQQK